MDLNELVGSGLRGWDIVTGSRPGLWPVHGSGVGAIGQGLAGAALGGLGSYLWFNDKDKETRDRLVRNWAIVSGLLGAGAKIPAMFTDYDMAKNNQMPDVDPKKPMTALFKWGSFDGPASISPQQALTNTNVAFTTILYDPTLDPVNRARALMLTQEASDDKTSLITTAGLARAAIGAGLGYTTGVIAGKALGALFATPPSTQKWLARAGAVGGILQAVGLME